MPSPGSGSSSIVTDTVVAFLAKIPPFQFLPAAELQSLAGVMALEYFPKDTVILRAGQAAAEWLYLVQKGAVKLAVRTGIGKELTLDMRSEGEIFGLLSNDGARRGASGRDRPRLKGSGITFNWAVVMVGMLMVAYVVFGGMLATTWVQIIKAILLMGGTILLSFLVLAHFHFSFPEFFDAIAHVKDGDKVVNFLKPGLRYKPPYGALDLISLGLALIFGTAGLPHILVRFYTVPDAKTARVSVVWAMGIIGSFYIMTTFLGFGAATIVGKGFIAKNGGINMSAPLLALAQNLAGDVFFAFVSAIAFATILAVVAGLTISASTRLPTTCTAAIGAVLRDDHGGLRIGNAVDQGIGGEAAEDHRVRRPPWTKRCSRAPR